ncbi:MAG: hypothetical protein B7Z57_06030 [Acidiphilium sp. 37-60-79]|nr:MAG: hypothetical protein B7Z57_06030 [Acidiphilium sp. 37-60-79]
MPQFAVTIFPYFRSARLSAIFEGRRESVAVAGECGAGRERRVFLEEVFEECQRGFWRRFSLRFRAGFAGFLGFSLQF